MQIELFTRFYKRYHKWVDIEHHHSTHSSRDPWTGIITTFQAPDEPMKITINGKLWRELFDTSDASILVALDELEKELRGDG